MQLPLKGSEFMADVLGIYGRHRLEAAPPTIFIR